MHLHPIPLDDWPWHCPCGARAQRRYSLCRKCQARAAWWRRNRRSRHVIRPHRVHRHKSEAVSGS
jgi:hypothetical protein